MKGSAMPGAIGVIRLGTIDRCVWFIWLMVLMWLRLRERRLEVFRLDLAKPTPSAYR